MKCFFCQSQVGDSDVQCRGCARTLKKFCFSCYLVYGDSANFCMACGGKLNDYIPKILKVSEIPEIPEIEIVDAHFEENSEHSVMVLDDFETKNEIEHTALAAEDDTENIEIVEVEPDVKGKAPRKEYLTLEIELNDSLPLDDAVEPVVETASDGLELRVSEIFLKDISKKLTPVFVDGTYNVNYEPLIQFIKEESSFPSLCNLFEIAGQTIKNGRGAMFFAEGEEGVGKSHFLQEIVSFSETRGLTGADLILTTANYLAFDYMVIIDFIKGIMGIKSDDLAEVKEKVEKYLGDALPKHKKECLIALLCFNFLPVKDKLPKNDLDFLFSYVIYMLTKRHPALWIIDNAWALNLRTVKFLKKLKDIVKSFALVIVLFTEPENAVFELSEESDKKTKFKIENAREESVFEFISKQLETTRIPTDIEKFIAAAKGNYLYAIETVRYLKDAGLIFLMKNSWRFGKLPEDLLPADSLEELVMLRYEKLEMSEQSLLKKLILLNINEIPAGLFASLFNEHDKQILSQLILKEYLVDKSEKLVFTSSSLFNIIRRNLKIDEDDKAFYKNSVMKLSSSEENIAPLNKNWLLLSYINLGGVVDKRFNSFLFSSAIYMEKLGFFEMAQRSYQSILSSFSKDDSYDDFKILLEIKNSKLWRFVDPQWGLIFWKKLKETAESKELVQLKLLAEAEILLGEPNRLDSAELVKIITQLHNIGCYENELFLLERFTDLLMESENYFDANTFALRSYKIIKDIFTDKRLGKISRDDVSMIFFIKSCIRLGEVNIALSNLEYANEVLIEAYETAKQYSAVYFQAKSMYLIGKIQYIMHESWEDYLQESFQMTLSEMQFAVLKSFFIFFEEEKLEDKAWLKPYLEYKNWLSIL